MYSASLGVVCLHDTLWRSSLLQERLAFLSGTTSRLSMRETLVAVVSAALGCRDELEAETATGGTRLMLDVTCQGPVLPHCLSFVSSLPQWQQRPLHLALAHILSREGHDVTAMRLVLSLLVKGAQECPARKAAVFSALVNRVSLRRAGEDRESALALCVREFVDNFKEKAFATVFLEPTKVYFNLTHNAVMEGDVEVHGSNTYQALLEAATGTSFDSSRFFSSSSSEGVCLSRACLWDDEVKGICDVLAVDAFVPVYEAICKQFGKSIGRIDVQLRLPPSDGRSFVFPRSPPGTTVRHLALNFALFPRACHEQFARYVDRFCWFFREEFFLRQLFQHLVVCGYADQLPRPEGVDDVRYFVWDVDERDPAQSVFRVDRARRVFEQMPRVLGGVQSAPSLWQQLWGLLWALWIALKAFFS